MTCHICCVVSHWPLSCVWPFMTLQITNVLSHLEQDKCFSPVWVLSWHFKSLMFCHIWSRITASLLCGSFDVSSNPHVLWMPCHIVSIQMASLLCGSFHASPNSPSEWMPCHIWGRQMASLLCGPFHGPDSGAQSFFVLKVFQTCLSIQRALKLAPLDLP